MDEEIDTDYFIMHNREFYKFLKQQRKDRNFQISIHLYDLISLSDLRPSITVWKEYIEGEMNSEVENNLFRMLIEYVLSATLDKFTRGIDILISDVESLLFTNTNLVPGKNIEYLKDDIRKYITTLAGKINYITSYTLNELDNFVFYPSEINNLPDHLVSNGYYKINDITIDCTKDSFFGTMEIFVIRKI